MKKILISSDCNGNFDKIFSKVADLHAKNRFDFMLMVGNVCPSQSSQIIKALHQENIQVPLPVYFIDNSDVAGVLANQFPEGKQICRNFHFLGRLGVKEIDGIRVAFVSGTNTSKHIQNGNYKGKFYSRKQYMNLIQAAIEEEKYPEILLTNEWPSQLKQSQEVDKAGNYGVSQLCYHLCPRYHIAAGSKKYVRLPPFKSKEKWPTHFINVAEIAGQLPKDKYLVAIQLNPNVTEQCPENVNENPFIKNQWTNQKFQVEKKQLLEGWDQEQQVKNKISPSALVQASRGKDNGKNKKESLNKNSYIFFEGFPLQTLDSEITDFMERWGTLKQIQIFKKQKGNSKTGIVRFKKIEDAQICLSDSGKYTLYNSRIKFSLKNQNQKYRFDDCYLCLNKANFDRSLLVHEAKLCFVCLDKGPVSQNHFQIVPINHVSSFKDLQFEEKQQINQIKKIYQNSFAEIGYTLITYERYMNLSHQINHCIIHCVPTKMTKNQVLQAFYQTNMSNRYGFVEEKPSIESQKSSKKSQYYIKLAISSSQGAEKKFVKEIDRKNRSFELGRQVICEMMNCPEKLNWRDCLMKPKQTQKSIMILRKMLDYKESQQK